MSKVAWRKAAVAKIAEETKKKGIVYENSDKSTSGEKALSNCDKKFEKDNAVLMAKLMANDKNVRFNKDYKHI